MQVIVKRGADADPEARRRFTEWFSTRRMTSDEEAQLQAQINEGRIATYTSDNGTEECRR